MNEDIKALIEREAHKIALFKHGNSLDAEKERIDTVDLLITFSNFALSLYKWRKVEEELPEDNKKVIIRTNLNDLYIASLCRDEDDYYFDSDCGSEFILREIREWMPIPNNEEI